MVAAAEVPQLVDAQTTSLATIYLTSVASARTATAGMYAWYDEVKLAKWAADLAKLLRSLQRQAATVTDSYLSRATSAQLGRRVDAVGPVDVDLLRTIPYEQVLIRPVETYRFRMWQGAEEPEARAAAVNRIGAIAETGVQLAQRQQGRKFLAERKAHGYRRIIHPELAKVGTCGLCITASDRIYKVDELLPIHARCNCTVLGIYGNDDPGLRLNRDDLDKLYADAGSNAADELKATRYTVNEHGELGPVLTRMGQPFRTQQQAEAARGRSLVLTDDQKREALGRVETSLSNMLSRDTETLAGAIAANRNRAEQLRADLSI